MNVRDLPDTFGDRAQQIASTYVQYTPVIKKPSHSVTNSIGRKLLTFLKRVHRDMTSEPALAITGKFLGLPPANNISYTAVTDDTGMCGLHLIMHRTIGLMGYIGPLTLTLTLTLRVHYSDSLLVHPIQSDSSQLGR